MPTSTLTAKAKQPSRKRCAKRSRWDPGDKLSWQIHGGTVAITTDRPSLLDFEGFIKNSSGDVVAEIAETRKTPRTSLTCVM